MAAQKTTKKATARKGEPKFDKNKSVEQNAYELKNAGLPWNRVEQLCGLEGNGSGRRAYRRYCKEIGETPRSFRNAPTKKAAPKPAAKKAASKKPVAKKAEVDA